jgi:hypothetical protein
MHTLETSFVKMIWPNHGSRDGAMAKHWSTNISTNVTIWNTHVDKKIPSSS